MEWVQSKANKRTKKKHQQRTRESIIWYFSASSIKMHVTIARSYSKLKLKEKGKKKAINLWLFWCFVAHNGRPISFRTHPNQMLTRNVRSDKKECASPYGRATCSRNMLQIHSISLSFFSLSSLYCCTNETLSAGKSAPWKWEERRRKKASKLFRRQYQSVIVPTSQRFIAYLLLQSFQTISETHFQRTSIHIRIFCVADIKTDNDRRTDYTMTTQKMTMRACFGI